MRCHVYPSERARANCPRAHYNAGNCCTAGSFGVACASPGQGRALFGQWILFDMRTANGPLMKGACLGPRSLRPSLPLAGRNLTTGPTAQLSPGLSAGAFLFSRGVD